MTVSMYPSVAIQTLHLKLSLQCLNWLPIIARPCDAVDVYLSILSLLVCGVFLWLFCVACVYVNK